MLKKPFSYTAAEVLILYLQLHQSFLRNTKLFDLNKYAG